MSERWEISFAADRLDEFHRLISKTNKRLAKAGAPVFEYAISAPFEKVIPKIGGGSVALPFVTVSLDHYRLSLGDYTFVAALVPEEAGWVVHTAPGESLDGWQRPAADDTSCDHCQTNRRRVRLYVVREDSTGKLIQLGHNCIQLYTGLEPKGLFALTFDQELKEFSEDDDLGGYGLGSRDYSVSIDTVLALSFAYSDGGRAYVSKAKAEEWNKEATVDLIRMHLFSPPKYTNHPNDRGYAEYMEWSEKQTEAAKIREDAALLAAIKASAETLRAGTDYADNMAIILAAESGYVSRRNVGVLASLLAVYRRGLEAAEPAGEAPAKGYLGEVGDKLKNVELTAKTVRVWEGYYGMTTFLVGATDSGHTIVWKASGRRDWEPGDRIRLTSATVKAQEVFNGTDQTVITRARVG